MSLGSRNLLLCEGDFDGGGLSPTTAAKPGRKRPRNGSKVSSAGSSRSSSRNGSIGTSYSDAVANGPWENMNDDRTTTIADFGARQRPHSTPDISNHFSNTNRYGTNFQSSPVSPGSNASKTPPRVQESQAPSLYRTPLRPIQQPNPSLTSTSLPPLSATHKGPTSPQTSSKSPCTCDSCRKNKRRNDKLSISSSSHRKEGSENDTLRQGHLQQSYSLDFISARERAQSEKIQVLEAKIEELTRQLSLGTNPRSDLDPTPQKPVPSITAGSGVLAPCQTTVRENSTSPRKYFEIPKIESRPSLTSEPSEASNPPFARQLSSRSAAYMNNAVAALGLGSLKDQFMDFYNVSDSLIQDLLKPDIRLSQPHLDLSANTNVQRKGLPKSSSEKKTSIIAPTSPNLNHHSDELFANDQFWQDGEYRTSQWQDLPMRELKPANPFCDSHASAQWSDSEHDFERGHKSIPRHSSAVDFGALRLGNDFGRTKSRICRTSKSLSPDRALDVRSRNLSSRRKRSGNATITEASADEADYEILGPSDIDLSDSEWEVLSRVNETTTQNLVSIIEQDTPGSMIKQEQLELQMPVTFLRPFSLHEDDIQQKIDLKNTIARLTERVQQLRGQIQDQRTLVADTHEQIFTASEDLTNLIMQVQSYHTRKPVVANIWDAFQESLKAHQSKRDDLGPMADELAIMENRLTAQENKLKNAWERLFKKFGLSENVEPQLENHTALVTKRSPARDDSASDSSEGSSDPEFDYPPDYVAWQDCLGQEDILKETLATYMAEKVRLEDERERRRKYNLALNPVDEQFLAEFTATVNPIKEELKIHETDSGRLREVCLRDGIIDEDGELIVVEDSDMETAEAASMPDTYNIIDDEKPSQSPRDETLESFDHESSDYMHVSEPDKSVSTWKSHSQRQEKNRQRVNVWLLEKLSFATTEVWLLATIAQVLLEDVNVGTIFRILQNWDHDGAGRTILQSVPEDLEQQAYTFRRIRKHIQEIGKAGFDKSIAILLVGHSSNQGNLIQNPDWSIPLSSVAPDLSDLGN
jgi:hypothetical protein